jgi:hypothetical protein
MVLKQVLFFLFILLLASCIEPYDFVVVATEPTLVIEAIVSDQSFDDTILYPSDGRYFTVNLSEAGNVTNSRATPVSYAIVRLMSEDGDSWQYTESDPIATPGRYLLLDDDFKANENVRYKIQVTLAGDDSYESSWERMPSAEEPVMGEIGFTERDVLSYDIEFNKQIVTTVRGITANIQLPENNESETIYYRWKFTPMWIYVAPLSRSVVLPGFRCWISNDVYLKDYAITADVAGGYSKDLFFLPTVRNARIFEDFTVLISQQTMTEPYYFYWKEMQEQTKAGAIFDAPPFNLHSNFVATNGGGKVVGYFGVVREQARRWYFNDKDLSYFVENALKADCSVPFQDIAPECFDCREYSFGDPVNVKPSWWR